MKTTLITCCLAASLFHQPSMAKKGNIATFEMNKSEITTHKKQSVRAKEHREEKSETRDKVAKENVCQRLATNILSNSTNDRTPNPLTERRRRKKCARQKSIQKNAKEQDEWNMLSNSNTHAFYHM